MKKQGENTGNTGKIYKNLRKYKVFKAITGSAYVYEVFKKMGK